MPYYKHIKHTGKLQQLDNLIVRLSLVGCSVRDIESKVLETLDITISKGTIQSKQKALEVDMLKNLVETIIEEHLKGENKPFYNPETLDETHLDNTFDMLDYQLKLQILCASNIDAHIKGIAPLNTTYLKIMKDFSLMK